MPSLKLGAILLILISLVSGCAVNPVTGKNELSWISTEQQVQIGAQQYSPSQQSQGGVYLADPALNAYVNEVGQRVAKHSPAKLPYEFVVLNNSVPNAWALPGGKIAVNRGLLLELNNEAELAAVLGHEVVHAAAKHGAQAMQRSTITQGLLTATAFAVSQSEYKDYGKYIVGGAQLGAQLIGTRYGREAELESDYYGIQYMHEAGYAPDAAISLQETFVRLSEGQQSSWLKGLFASHPPSIERVNTNRRTVAALAGADGNLFDGRFAEHMKHLRATKPAYDKLGRAQSLASAGEYGPALRSLDQASKLEPKEARFHGQRGNIFYQMKDYAKAEAAFDQALALDDQYFEYYLGRGLTRSKRGNASLAKQDLQMSNNLLPTAAANQSLGEIALSGGDRNGAKQFFAVAMGAAGNIGAAAKLAYSRLDVKDNPGKYIDAQLKPNSEGQLIVVISNRSSVNLKGLELHLSAIIDAQNLSRTLKITDLAKGQTTQHSSGWQLNETSVLQQVQFSVTKLVVE